MIQKAILTRFPGERPDVAYCTSCQRDVPNPHLISVAALMPAAGEDNREDRALCNDDRRQCHPVVEMDKEDVREIGRCRSGRSIVPNLHLLRTGLWSVCRARRLDSPRSLIRVRQSTEIIGRTAHLSSPNL